MMITYCIYLLTYLKMRFNTICININMLVCSGMDICMSGLLKCHNKIVDDGDALTLCVLVLTPAFYFRFRWNGNLNCSVAREAVGKRERNELLQGYLLRRGQPEGNGETWSLHLQNENLLISPIQFSIFVSL